MMKINPFQMERWQSTWEHRVELNLSESGVHPMTPAELLELGEVDPGELLRQRLGYNQSNGSDDLRASIARLYPGAGPENVLVTNGGSEANFVTTWSLFEPGATVVMQTPNYMQMWGQAETFAREVRSFRLVEERSWSPDLDELRDRAKGASAIIVTNPNNPTGSILSEDEIDEIVGIADGAGAWIIADEIYAGAELDEAASPTFWGRYDRLIVTAGLSKAYGLPGLRVGWALGPPDVVEDIWAYKDYTTIAPGVLSDFCARVALTPTTRQRIRERTRSILLENLPTITTWLDRRPDIFSFVPPRAGAICYARYELDIGSSEIARRLKDEHSVLIVPGDHFHMDGYVRIGYGLPRPELLEALNRIETLVRSLSG